MKFCEDCKKEIGEQYTFCVSCSNKRKAEKATAPARSIENDPLLRAVGAMNNNLYRLVRQNDVILRLVYGIEIVWDKTKKDFVEKKIAGGKNED